MTRQVAVVPHTHWDREWYASFAAFRLRLVDMLDEFLPHLDADGGYRRFLLDGQMAVVDDYLELRPDAEETLRRLAASGRLALGPWYILMDEFCVSGETIIRNLQLGLERAARFGGAMAVGYLPDMFGHIAQMPQVLAAAGLEHAVVWRGVPSAIARTAFWWQAPDGSRVRAEYLPVGYSNGAATPPEAALLLRRIRAHEAEIGAFLGPDDPMLWMNGTDHQAPQSWLPAVVAACNETQDDYELRITSLAEYLAGAPCEDLAVWQGEMRSGARTNVLMGVLSNRVDVKMAAARAERELERRAEPLSALWLAPPRWPQAVFDDAWLQVIRNSAHDSICACSADAVATAVLHRFDDATDAAAGLAARALQAGARRVAQAGPLVINPSARTRSGLVELVLAAPEAPAGTQLIDAVAAGTHVLSGSGRDFGRLLGELTAGGWLPSSGTPTAAVLHLAAGGLHVELRSERVTATASTPPSVGPAMAEAWAQAGAGRDRPLRVSVTRPASVRVLARAEQVPGYGWATWQGGGLGVAAVTGGDGWLANGELRLRVNRGDGTFSIGVPPGATDPALATVEVAGLGRLVDSGDAGDTYNYSPADPDHVVDAPSSVQVELLEAGPVRGRLALIRRFEWPARLDARGHLVSVEVRTVLELRAGERLVRMTTSFDNPARDHRLRALFPLPRAASHSTAECAFATVTRGLDAEGGPHERGLPTFPARRFVQAGGLSVVHDGLLEYELIDAGRTLALTLLRATGHLSRPAPAYRPNSAGPDLEVDGPQLLGPLEVRYGVALGDDDPYELVEDAWLPLEALDAPGGGDLGASGTLLEVCGGQVSSLRRVDGLLELRVFNPADASARIEVVGRHGWLVDLRGQALEPFTGGFELRPWGLATARLAE